MSLVARSLLFVPGNRPDRFAKAVASGAHAVIIDLEDSVPPSDRPAARAAATEWLSVEGHRAMLRVNGPATEWHADDLEAATAPGVIAIVVPKVERADELRAVAGRLGERPLLPIIETARGVDDVGPIARVPATARLAFGSLDLGIDLGIHGVGEELDYFRARVVLASRLASLEPPVGGVTTDFQSDEQLRIDTLRERRFGFGGKLCIHPRQIAVVHACFRPSDAELAWAKRVVETSQRAGGAAVQLDGRMIDRPVVIQAEAMLAEASR